MILALIKSSPLKVGEMCEYGIIPLVLCYMAKGIFADVTKVTNQFTWGYSREVIQVDLI